MAIDTYRKQGRGGKGVIGSDTKEGDFIEHLFSASTHDYLLVFTNRGKCYWLKVYDIPSMSRQSKGRSVANLLKLGDQQIASIINVRKFDDETEQQRQLVMATKKGLVKKTKLIAYSNPRTTGVIAIKLDLDDDVIGVSLTTGNDQIILGTRNGMTIRFEEQQVRSMGRVSRGVIGIRLRDKKDSVVGMVIVEKDASLLTVCERGYGKRTKLEDYRSQSRGGIGLINIKTTARNGKVVALKAVHDEDELMMITANGIIIRTGLEQVRTIGRNTQGVRLIKIKPDDKLVAAEKIISTNHTVPKELKANKEPKDSKEPEVKKEPKVEKGVKGKKGAGAKASAKKSKTSKSKKNKKSG
jgi:DNA gyrase subunit A